MKQKILSKLAAVGVLLLLYGLFSPGGANAQISCAGSGSNCGYPFRPCDVGITWEPAQGRYKFVVPVLQNVPKGWAGIYDVHYYSNPYTMSIREFEKHTEKVLFKIESQTVADGEPYQRGSDGYLAKGLATNLANASAELGGTFVVADESGNALNKVNTNNYLFPDNNGDNIVKATIYWYPPQEYIHYSGPGTFEFLAHAYTASQILDRHIQTSDCYFYAYIGNGMHSLSPINITEIAYTDLGNHKITFSRPQYGANNFDNYASIEVQRKDGNSWVSVWKKEPASNITTVEIDPTVANGNREIAATYRLRYYGYYMGNSSYKFYERYSGEVTINPISIPQNLKAVDKGCNQIELSWNVGTTNQHSLAGDFYIYVHDGNGWIPNYIPVTYSANKNEYIYTYTIPDSYIGKNTTTGNTPWLFELNRRPFTNAGNNTPVKKTVSLNKNMAYQIATVKSISSSGGTGFNLKWTTNDGYYCDAYSYKVVVTQPQAVGTPKTYTSLALSSGDLNNHETVVNLSGFNSCDNLTVALNLYKGDVLLQSNLMSSQFILDDGSQPSYIETLNLSKGFFSNRVTLEWNVNSQNLFAYYAVYRKEFGSKGADQLITTLSSSAGLTQYKYDDLQAVPGQYYTYTIRGLKTCSAGGDLRTVDSKSGSGYVQPYGAASGRIAYAGSTAVPNVTVMVEGTEKVKNKALSFTESGGGFIETPYKEGTLSEAGFTYQAWVNTTKTATFQLLSASGKYEAWIENNKVIIATSAEVAFNKITFDSIVPLNEYHHITLTYDSISKNCSFYLDGILKQTKVGQICKFRTNEKDKISIGGSVNSTSFVVTPKAEGYIDEVRLWTRALDSAEITTNFGTYISGKEDGLALYYRLDEMEGIGEVYDISGKDNNNFNQNHGIIQGTVSRVNDASQIPTTAQLSVKGITNANGYFLITTIPYTGDGSTFNISPNLGVHRFDPSMRPLYFSSTSNTQNNVDFTDVSSFQVTGKVFYANSNYPVEGAQLSVDGVAATKDGELITTKEDGSYSIDVPIGDHFITVTKQGHVFANGGRYPAYEGNRTEQRKENFQTPLSGLNFYDNTTVLLAGRVAGGDIETKKPLGFGLSTANIGKASITLESTKEYLFDERTDSATIGGKTTKTSFTNNYIKTTVEITTDPETGEFLAVLPPVPFTVSGAKTKKLEKTDFAYTKERIDINPNTVDTLSYTDPETQVKVQLFVQDTLKITHYSNPVLSVNDLGNPYGAFGDSIYVYTVPGSSQKDTISLYNTENGKLKNYVLDYPVFSQLTGLYNWEISAFEEYLNYDVDANNPERSTVPLEGKEIDIENGLSSLTVLIDTLNNTYELTSSHAIVVLDKAGKAKYGFRTGFPNLGGDNRLAAKIKLTQNNKEYVWQSPNAKDLSDFTGYLLGMMPSDGSNFVTQGPDNVDIVLHDPPGSNSYAYIEKGSFFSKEINEYNDYESFKSVAATIHLGQVVSLSTGVVVSLGFEIEGIIDLTGAVESGQQWGNNNTRQTATTFNQRIATSDSPDHVGSGADVYVGQSTNRTFGKVRYLNLYPKLDFAVEPLIGTNDYKLGEKEVLSVDQKFKTVFTYTQDYILNTQIPNVKQLRNQLLITRNPIPNKDTVVFNANKDPLYFTDLPASDPNFGKEKTYFVYFAPDAPDEKKIDQVLLYNEWINNWEKTIENNEKGKANLFDNRAKAEGKTMENHSFDAGAKFSASTTASLENLQTSYTSHTFGEYTEDALGVIVGGIGAEVHATFGRNNAGGSDTTAVNASECTFGYELSEDGMDALTVDVYNPLVAEMHKSLFPDSIVTNLAGYTFYTAAGQTSCPYEGEERSLFYKKGEYVLNQGTFQIEKPDLLIDGLKAASAENIPSGREATFILQLINNSDINMPVSYKLSVADNSNKDGLILSIDGTPLTNPREYTIGYGSTPEEKTIYKTLKVRQSSTDILDYSGIKLALSSTCDDAIRSEANIGVKFIPSSTDSKLAANATLVNLSGGTGASKDTTLTFTISEYDRSFKNFASLRLEYKNINDPNWSLTHEFINDTIARPLTDPNTQELIPAGAEGATIKYKFSLKDLSDGTYDFRSLSRSILGNENIDVPSNELRIIKDLKAPVPLGNPSPVNGILTPEGELSVLFNENIKATNLSDRNVSVKAIMNGKTIGHSVAMKLSGGAPASSEANFALAGHSFSFETWIQRTPGQAGTILAHGNEFSIGFNAANNIVVTFNGSTYTSAPVPGVESGWNYLQFSYENKSNEAGVFVVNLLTETHGTIVAFSNQVVSAYTGNGKLYVGAKSDGSTPFTGAIQELSLWNSARLLGEATVGKDTGKTGKERNLLAYWSLTEGHGTIAIDKARSRHLVLPSANYWYLRNENKALTFNGTTDVLVINADAIPITTDESFAVEFWFKGGGNQTNATLFSCGDAISGTINNPEQKLSIGFDGNGKLNLRAKGDSYNLSNENYLDSIWHHFALNVLRNGSVIAYVDGASVKQLSGAAVGSMASDFISLGAFWDPTSQELYKSENHFAGSIDELRIWKATLSADAIRQNIYNRLHGNENGLLAYYPFEETYTDSGNQQKTRGTFADKQTAGISNGGTAQGLTDANFSDEAPMLKEARSLENVDHTFTASNNKIVIDIIEPDYRIENTTLEISVEGVLDLNNNPSKAVNWTAYVNRNRLRWGEDNLNILKAHLEESKYEIYVYNESGKDENWVITGLPAWLSVSKSNGTLKPLSNDKLIFTVNPSTPIGSYEEVIYLTGSNQIDVPLGISLKVTAQKPNWTVNPADFESSMTVTGQIQILGVPQEDTDDILAAFNGDVCVGLVSPQYIEDLDAYLTFMTVYGNASDEGKSITFKLWDAGTGRVYPSLEFKLDGALQTPKYKAMEIYGLPYTPVIHNALDFIEQSIAIKQGWNQISVNVSNNDSTLFNQFKAIVGNAPGNILKFRDPYAQTGDNGWAGSLTSIENTAGYKFKSIRDLTLTLVGKPVDVEHTPITLASGWTWIGYTPQFSLKVQDALAGLNPQLTDQIKGRDGYAQYTTAGWLGGLGAMQPGAGYMYYSKNTTNQTLVYPSVSPIQFRSAVSSTITEEDRKWTANKNRFSESMTVTSIVLVDGIEQHGDQIEIAAFSGEECRGSVLLDYFDGNVLHQDLGFLMIYGEENESIKFRVYDHSTREEYKVLTPEIRFTADGMLGDPAEPYRIIAGSLTGIGKVNNQINVYPNPVKDVLWINAPWNKVDVLQISDISGRILLEKTDFVEESINVSRFNAGTYLLKLTKDGQTYIHKIVKK